MKRIPAIDVYVNEIQSKYLFSGCFLPGEWIKIEFSIDECSELCYYNDIEL